MTGVARYDFSGTVAVVTGGAQGIGRAVAERLAQAGATLSIWDLKPPPDEVFAGVHHVAFDICDHAAVERAEAQTREAMGPIGVLVHSAGYAGETMPLDALPPDAWHRIVDINLNGTYHVCRAVVPAMRTAGRGRIVTIASLAGKEGTPNAAAYSAAKAGVIALTKSLGKELAGTGVFVNAIAPAAIETPLLAQMAPEHVATMIAKSPLKRLGTTAEVAEMALWLASDSCSFNVGAVFDLSGGRATY